MSDQPAHRKPRAFTLDDPGVVELPPEPATSAPEVREAGMREVRQKAAARRGFGWGTLLLSSFAGLATLAASLSFARFVSVALERQDWLGWLATGLLATGLSAALVLVGREIVGLMRLRRLGDLRRDAAAALATQDRKAEADVARRLAALYDSRSELGWSLARFREHRRDVHDAGGLLALADREVVAPLDVEARRMVMKSCKRVATVTAISPMAVIAVGFVAVESLRMMRGLAALYGGRPGLIGALRLARLVVGYLVATGGIALTDDLIGQFIGQDVLRRLSRRLGEGAFNGALTARLGAAAIDVIRPLPFIEATPVRARDFVAEMFRRQPKSTVPETPAG